MTLKSEWEKIIMLLVPLVPHLAYECIEKINGLPAQDENTNQQEIPKLIKLMP